MAGHRVALVTTTALAAWTVSGDAVGQSREPARDPAREPAGEIEMAPAKDQKVARKWLAVGQQLMQRGLLLASRNRPDEARPQFENAAVAYRKAIEASDDVNVYVELASAEEKLGKLDDAVRHLGLVVKAGTGVRPDVGRRATAKLEELLAKVGRVTLTVAPAGTSITLGGIELGTSPLSEPLVLLPGTYTLAFQADGFQPQEAELKVEPGMDSERAIELAPVKVAEPARPVVVVEKPRVEPPPPRSRLPLIVGAAVSGAAVAGAGIFGALALRQHTAFSRSSTSATEREDARASGRLLAHLADAAIGTAVVASGFTAYWYFYRYRRRSAPSAADRSGKPAARATQRHASWVETKLHAVPWVQPQLGGMTIAGWF